MDTQPEVRKTIIGPPHSRIAEEAVAQFHAIAALPGCVCAAAMPDLHPGRGIPIGAVFAMDGVVYPHLVGNDAGCGARVVFTDLVDVAKDKLERKLRRLFVQDHAWVSDLCENSEAEMVEVIWHHGTHGLRDLKGVPDLLLALCEREPRDAGLPASAPLLPFAAGAPFVLGTIGGGNHFAEVSQVASVTDASAAAGFGIRGNATAVIVHSGSRGIGEMLAAKWGKRDVREGNIAAYLAELAGACRFAQVNRLLLAYRLLRGLGVHKIDHVTGMFDIVHNDVRQQQHEAKPLWVHRKGAAPALQGAPTVVLGSRGTPSWILAGTGNDSALCSVAHGAGRRLSRADARERLKAKYKRAELSRTAVGSRVICEDPALLYEEHPDAYKPIEPIIHSLEDAGAASRVASLLPMVTVKV